MTSFEESRGEQERWLLKYLLKKKREKERAKSKITALLRK
jgi:hypothetical protein